MKIDEKKEYALTAKVENLDSVLRFIGEGLEGTGCSEENKALIFIAAEEIFVNVAHYAYGEEEGGVVVRLSTQGSPPRMTLQFEDGGVPYNPLEKEDPDIELSAEERGIGGLGIFMVKETMDAVHYEYKNGRNLFTMEKVLL